ncbi:GNAT family N-acetyltransferase [Paenibacillus protaetiae]|uniref:GNAT family N-acetyltransferase n=1 Tax=Paenibacillus protaetiae TaxID=2509456 RepID=UPI0013EBFBD0|nr:GNAT family N-acetyltransferase [Paenibacillus protaetiae]
MLSLVKITDELIKAELDILNADSYYNRVSTGQETVTPEELAKEKEQAAKLGAERYLVQENGRHVGILDFLMVNPNDNCAWLGLLQVNKPCQGQGYGRRMLELYMNMMKERGVAAFRIGILEDNEPGFQFWMKQGFDYVKTVVNDRQKTVLIYEKTIG